MPKPLWTYLTALCRLRYTSGMGDWEFAIFKYSEGNYDADEWMFPGSEHVE
jgi:hypothetical protein